MSAAVQRRSNQTDSCGSNRRSTSRVPPYAVRHTHHPWVPHRIGFYAVMTERRRDHDNTIDRIAGWPFGHELQERFPRPNTGTSSAATAISGQKPNGPLNLRRHPSTFHDGFGEQL